MNDLGQIERQASLHGHPPMETVVETQTLPLPAPPVSGTTRQTGNGATMCRTSSRRGSMGLKSVGTAPKTPPGKKTIGTDPMTPIRTKSTGTMSHQPKMISTSTMTKPFPSF